jgi:azurin
MRTVETCIVLFALAGAGCDNKAHGSVSSQPSASEAPPPPAQPVPSSVPSAPPEPKKVELQIASVGNEMRFDKTALTVPTGAEVHLVLKNTATMGTMSHNWVLVKPGVEARVALDGLTNASNSGFVVPGPDVYAFTPLAAPGATTELTFTAPAPGKYPYICTFPGHYLQMKGVLTVTP